MTNDDIPELRGLTPDELRFYRLIDSREPDPPGEKLTLACGHALWAIGAESRQYMYCSECLNAWLAAERASRVEST